MQYEHQILSLWRSTRAQDREPALHVPLNSSISLGFAGEQVLSQPATVPSASAPWHWEKWAASPSARAGFMPWMAPGLLLLSAAHGPS